MDETIAIVDMERSLDMLNFKMEVASSFKDKDMRMY